MGNNTAISWTDASWNPVVGCSLASPGCTNCYAMPMAARIAKMQPAGHYAGLTKRVNGHPVWTGKIAPAPDHIWTAPLHWKKPRRIFVNSMGDLFHDDVPDEWVDRVFAVMALCPQHKFQVLTKRSKRMREYMLETWQPAKGFRLSDDFEVAAETHGETRLSQVERACEPFLQSLGLADTERDELWTEDGSCKAMQWKWPLPNCWLGISAEDQLRADERIPDLLATPAAVRFVSYEPALGPIDFEHIHHEYLEWMSALKRVAEAAWLDWIICGGESGPGHRPMQIEWAESLRWQCKAAGVPFFFKQDSGPRSGMRGRASDDLWNCKEFPE